MSNNKHTCKKSQEQSKNTINIDFPFYTTHQAAIRLNLSYHHLFKLTRKNIIPSLKISGAVFVPKSYIDNLKKKKNKTRWDYKSSK
jgi:hypothetical protein